MTGASRWRTAGLTAVFIGGVATVVWPLTVGAAGLSQLISANHEAMVLLGGVMMLLVGAATLRGWMWHRVPSLGGGYPSGLVGIYLECHPAGEPRQIRSHLPPRDREIQPRLAQPATELADPRR